VATRAEVNAVYAAGLILGIGLSAACVVVTVFILSRRRWN
jgi:hypothetical protein